MEKVREAAKRLLSPEDFEVAEDTVSFLKGLLGPWPVETREIIEGIGWFLDAKRADLLDLSAEGLGLGESVFWGAVLGVAEARRPDLCSIEMHFLRLARGPAFYRVVVECHYLARLKWTRVHDRKKARRALWGKAKYSVVPYINKFADPHRDWLLEHYRVEMEADRKEGRTFKRKRTTPKPPALKLI